MPPRLRLRSLNQIAELNAFRSPSTCLRCQYATAATATATTPAPTEAQLSYDIAYSTRYSPVQPPSYRDPKYRRSQLLRSYVSLLESTPLIIIFQHNNLKALEWASIRREVARALQKVDDDLQSRGATDLDLIADSIKLQVVQTKMLENALRITEYYRPTVQHEGESQPTPVPIESERQDPSLTHALSESAYIAAKANRHIHPLTPLLTGNIALLNFPSVSPQHVKAALSILAPLAPGFPAPSRKMAPTFHEPVVQDGLKKMMLLGARIDGQVFDTEGTRWVGGIEGGITGLRAQLVGMLQGFGAGVTQTLESASRSVWFTMEGRRRMLEEENSGPKEE